MFIFRVMSTVNFIIWLFRLTLTAQLWQIKFQWTLIGNLRKLDIHASSHFSEELLWRVDYNPKRIRGQGQFSSHMPPSNQRCKTHLWQPRRNFPSHPVHVFREIIVFLLRASAEIRKRNYHGKRRVSPETSCINTAVARYAKRSKCKATCPMCFDTPSLLEPVNVGKRYSTDVLSSMEEMARTEKWIRKFFESRPHLWMSNPRASALSNVKFFFLRMFLAEKRKLKYS